MSTLASSEMGSARPREIGAQLDRGAIRRLASRIAGQLVTPESSEYGTARAIFNLAFDRNPALIVRCATAPDVARTLDFAQTHHLPLAVRGGGHSRAGLSLCDGGVVIDLSRMNQVEVDVHKGVARAQAGALVVHLDSATQRFGMATTSGGCPTVGIAGLTLGGGEGLLMSKYGAACDNLISAQIVTADGRRIEASESIHPDLFWAIRGGGGNFGIATALEFKLHPLTDVLAGTLVYPAGRISELLGSFATLVAAAPDEMNVVGVVSSAVKGAHFQMLVCHCGDARVGNDLLGTFRSLNPQEDTVRVAPYLEVNATINPAAPAAHFQTNLFLPNINSKAIATIAAATDGAPPGTRVFIVPIYGAIARVPVDDTAFGLRSFGYELDIMGRWVDPADKARAIQWVKTLRDALRSLARGAYVNQLGETSNELVRFAYGTNYSRLAAIKKKYDPGNVLRSNQNIIPA
jgi:FAD/FMN-containing dehydrogenase